MSLYQLADEIDFEAALMAHLPAGEEPPAVLTLTAWINDEGRLTARVGEGEKAREFVIFGNNVAQVIRAQKPPTQRAAVIGIDAYRSMGDRR